MKPLYRRVVLDARAETYLAQIEKESTRATNQFALQAFYAFRCYGAASPTPLSWKAMTFNVLAEFGKWLQDQGYGTFSRKTYSTCVSEFLKYALDAEWLKPDFSVERAAYRRRKSAGRSKYPVPQPDPRVPELIAYYEGQPWPELAGDTPRAVEQARVKRLCLLRNRAVMQTLYASAGRVSEVASLDRKQLQDGRRNETVITGKGDKDRFIFLTPAAQRAIQVYCREREDEYEPLFISHGRNKGQRLSRQMLWKIVTDAAQVLGIEASPHTIRHFRAKQMINEKVPAEFIQKILGHEDISTTLNIYAQLDRESVRAEFDRVT